VVQHCLASPQGQFKNEVDADQVFLGVEGVYHLELGFMAKVSAMARFGWPILLFCSAVRRAGAMGWFFPSYCWRRM
jgi:hypothetical protein